MASSPYLSEELKEYIRKHKIEETLTRSINEMLAEKYKDPYSFLILKFSEFTSNSVELKNLKAYEIINNEGTPTIQVNFGVEYKLEKFTISPGISFSLTAENQKESIWDADRYNGKGLQSACDLINTQVLDVVKGMDITNQKKVDDVLLDLYQKNGNNCFNAIFSVSFSLSKVVSQLKNIPLFSCNIKKLFIDWKNLYGFSERQLPNIFVNVLQGSKLVFKYQLVVDTKSIENSSEIFRVINTVIAFVKKTICSGKQGEAALKFYQDGSFLCTADTIVDNLKIIEEAINQSNCKEFVGIGLVWNADLFFNPDQKKYELENPKQLLDTDQLIEYYFKLCNDRPLICYMEDPLYSMDKDAWIKLLAKFEKTNVKIGSRKVYNSIETLQQLNKEPEPSEDNPEEVPQINLDYSFFQFSNFVTFTHFYEFWKLLSFKKVPTKMILCENITQAFDCPVIDVSFAFPNCVPCLNPPIKNERLIPYNKYIELSNFLE